MRKHLARIPTAVLSAVIWVAVVSWMFQPPSKQVETERLAGHHTELFDQRGVAAPSLRVGNPEWDLMQRMYWALALSDRLTRGVDPTSAARLRRQLDALVEDTLEAYRDEGSYHFLLGYAHAGAWKFELGRSLFVDGEITMMLAARRMVNPGGHDRLDGALRDFMDRVSEQLAAAPVCAESYPDECWTFCNTTALAALRVGDAALGTDHRALATRWLEAARQHLVDPATGLFVSSARYDGTVLDGPEGSSLWMLAHNLRLLDESLARDQYRRAREELAIDVAGFGFAREWPRSSGRAARVDIDSGPVIPLLEASAGSSGLALLGAASFGDDAYFEALSRSLGLAAFPVGDDKRVQFAAAGDMGNAVAFAAHETGPLWAAVVAANEQRVVTR